MVCTANVCRSPIGEALLRHALEAEPAPLGKLRVVSAGVSAWKGDPASPHSVRVLKKVGVELGAHRSQPLTRELLDRSCLVLVMTEAHRQFIRRTFAGELPPIRLFREMMPDPDRLEVPDPFGSNLAIYEACRDSMVEAVPSVLEELRSILQT